MVRRRSTFFIGAGFDFSVSVVCLMLSLNPPLQVHLPEFPWQEFHKTPPFQRGDGGDCPPHGRTYEEAAKNGQEVIEAFVEMLIEENKPLPEPRMLPQKPLKVV